MLHCNDYFLERVLMTFDEWMIHKKLSNSTALKYEGAINGSLSDWAIENDLISGPLTSIIHKTSFDAIALKIAKLPVFIDRNERGHHMYSSALAKYSEYLAEGYESDVESDIEAILEDNTINETDKISLVKCRIGQGTFRQKLIGYWRACSATKLKDTNLLIASHIKPWKASTNTERLDVFNGLLLTPNLDKAFDSGLITFDDSGKIKISPQLLEPEKLGINTDQSVLLAPEHLKYMGFHRDFVYRSA
jgi:putative restriction endonuclease